MGAETRSDPRTPLPSGVKFATTWMGTLLVVHLALVFSLYFTVPYGKFAHFVYRYAALVQNRIEERAEG